VSEITLEELLARRDELALIDVRSHAEYTGEAGYPCDPRQGHVPGARNLVVEGHPPEEVREIVGLPEGAAVVAYCHSGARSARAVPWLEAAGYEAYNYAGSWHEWSRRDELPVETG
jgi:thiosulfate/3-mercaptopyruvate sulfurtransferase